MTIFDLPLEIIELILNKLNDNISWINAQISHSIFYMSVSKTNRDRRYNNQKYQLSKICNLKRDEILITSCSICLKILKKTGTSFKINWDIDG